MTVLNTSIMKASKFTKSSLLLSLLTNESRPLNASPHDRAKKLLGRFTAATALGCLLCVYLTPCSAGVARFERTTDTISVSGGLSLGNAATFEARILLTHPITNYAFVFNEWTDGQEDKTLVLSTGPMLYGFAYPVGGSGLTASDILSLNEWHHIAYVYDGTEERLYLDGSLRASRLSRVRLEIHPELLISEPISAMELCNQASAVI